MALKLQCREPGRSCIPYSMTATLWRAERALAGRSQGRTGNHSGPRPSAPAKARLDAARDHPGNEKSRASDVSAHQAVDLVDQTISNQICSPVVLASSKGSIKYQYYRRQVPALHVTHLRAVRRTARRVCRAVALRTQTTLTRRYPAPHAWASSDRGQGRGSQPAGL
jgi:hypothetical protein